DGRVWAKFPATLKDEALPAAPARDYHRFEKESLLLFKPILDPDNGEVIGTLFLQSSLSQMYSRIRQYVGIVSAVLVLSLIVALVLSSRLQRLISEPVLKLSDTARIVSERKDYGLRAEKGSEDEVGVLIDS